MKVQDVMTENAKFCWPDTNLATAAATMWENDCGVLPVLADGRTAIGVITDRDIAIALGTRNRKASDIKVREVISGKLCTANPEDDIHTALKIMRREKVHRLPVIDAEGALKGVLSLNDVALQAAHPNGKKTPELNYEDVVATLKAICEHRPAKAKARFAAAKV
ncbi:MAG TPA: CBS domain-containing protein [Blastocatellia bacterium]|nr:CBS domain-containing protein [Blastocatellia bacterium]